MVKREHVDEDVNRALIDEPPAVQSSCFAWLVRCVCLVPCARKLAAVSYGGGPSSLCDHCGLHREKCRGETGSYLGPSAWNLLVLSRCCEYLEGNGGANV